MSPDPVALRRNINLKRTPLVLALALITGGILYLTLYLIEPILHPPSPVGAIDTWHIGPPRVIKAAIAAFSVPFLMPLITAPFARRWRAQEAAAGAAPPIRFREWSLSRKVRGLIILVIYAALVVFLSIIFVFEQTTVSPKGIRVFNQFRYIQHAFNDVQLIEHLPEGMIVAGPKSPHGPFARLRFTDGSFCQFGHSEGLNAAEVGAIVTYISERSGQPITLPMGASPR